MRHCQPHVAFTSCDSGRRRPPASSRPVCVGSSDLSPGGDGGEGRGGGGGVSVGPASVRGVGDRGGSGESGPDLSTDCSVGCLDT